MDRTRASKLRRNFKLMFWIQALTEIKVLNVISTIFYVHRGLSLSQVFYLAIAFAVVSALSEVPSSYLADKWGRKRMIIVALLIGVVYWTFNLTAYGIVAMLVANSLYALGYSVMSGTDEALVYDSAKELGEESSSIKKMGLFFSSQRIFKIVTPVVAVLIARDLTDIQFMAIIAIDIAANLLALFLSDFLIEPSHFLKLEKVDVGVLKSSLKLLNNTPKLLPVIINRSIFFIASFVVWRVSSEYFKGLGISVLLIGILASGYQLTTFILNVKSHEWFSWWSSERVIGYLNWINIAALTLLTINEFGYKSPWVAMAAFWIISVSECVRWPYFSDLFNKFSQSHNRATTLSLANMLGSMLQIPIFVFGSILVAIGYSYLFALILAAVIITHILFRVEE